MIRRFSTALAVAAALSASAASAAEPAKGRFLIASERVLDPNFFRTVVLLLDHGADGSVGLIVNRETDLEASQVVPDIEGLEGRGGVIWIGGPVEPRRIHVLVRAETQPGEAEAVAPGLWATADRPALEKVLADKAATLRVYAGYAGWAPGQLEGEIERGDWLIVPAGAAAVFDPAPETLWQRLLDRASVRFAFSPGVNQPPATTP